jgi:hypothetical protein
MNKTGFRPWVKGDVTENAKLPSIFTMLRCVMPFAMQQFTPPHIKKRRPEWTANL